MLSLSKLKAVLWPRQKQTDIYFDRKSDNSLSLDIALLQDNDQNKLEPLSTYLAQNKVDGLTVFVPDDVVHTKSFIYDAQIDQIDPEEIASLAQGSVQFKVDPASLEYSLFPSSDKTIILARIFNQKFASLKKNVASLGLKDYRFLPVSSAAAAAISSFYGQRYFLVYPLNSHSYTLVLAKGDSVYLTSNIKGPSLEIQKIINYSNLYFSSPVNKVFYPHGQEIDIVSTTELDKTEYQESQIAQKLNKPTNLPLPVAGVFQSAKTFPADIIRPDPNNSLIPETKKMETTETKKNILPLVAVFVLTASLASVAIWYALNRGDQSQPSTANVTPTEIPVYPTEAPTPTPVPIDKKIKIQVLNATSINGQAATLKEKLVGLGFTNITVGNSNEKVDGNEIRLKSSLSDASEYFVQSMPYFPASISAELKDTSNYDVVFVIGSDLNNPSPASMGDSPPSSQAETTPTVKATPTL